MSQPSEKNFVEDIQILISGGNPLDQQQKTQWSTLSKGCPVQDAKAYLLRNKEGDWLDLSGFNDLLQNRKETKNPCDPCGKNIPTVSNPKPSNEVAQTDNNSCDPMEVFQPPQQQQQQQQPSP